MKQTIEEVMAEYTQRWLDTLTFSYIQRKLNTFGYYEFIIGSVVIEAYKGRFNTDVKVVKDKQVEYEGLDLSEGLEKFKSLVNADKYRSI